MTQHFAISPSKVSTSSHGVITSYSAQTTPGLIRPHNEDRIALILNIKTNQPANSSDTQSFIGIYDGHAGSACADYLRDTLHAYLGREGMFASPSENKIVSAFSKAETAFLQTALNETEESAKIIERSGSCALCVIITGKKCFIANVGDSRAVLSKKKGQEIVQLTRDHKPGDKDEEQRILNNQGRIYQTQIYNQNKKTSEQLYGPLRVFPGRLSVCRTFGDIEAKNVKLGGNPKVVIAEPEISVFDIDEDYDFIILGSYFFQLIYVGLGDGIYDKLSSEEVVKAGWQGLHSQKFSNEHEASGLVAENVIQEAMRQRSLDNLSVVVICFENFRKAINEIQSQQKGQGSASARQNEIQNSNLVNQQKSLMINTLEQINNLKSNLGKVYSQSTKNQNQTVKLFTQKNQNKPVEALKEVKNEQNLNKADENKQKIEPKKLKLNLLSTEDKENQINQNQIQSTQAKQKQFQHIDALYAISPKIKAQTTQAQHQLIFNFNNESTQDQEVMNLKMNQLQRKIAFNNDNYYQQTKQLINSKLKKSLTNNENLLNFQKKISQKNTGQVLSKLFKKSPTQEIQTKLKDLFIEGKNNYTIENKQIDSSKINNK